MVKSPCSHCREHQFNPWSCTLYRKLRSHMPLSQEKKKLIHHRLSNLYARRWLNHCRQLESNNMPQGFESLIQHPYKLFGQRQRKWTHCIFKYYHVRRVKEANYKIRIPIGLQKIEIIGQNPRQKNEWEGSGIKSAQVQQWDLAQYQLMQESFKWAAVQYESAACQFCPRGNAEN